MIEITVRSIWLRYEFFHTDLHFYVFSDPELSTVIKREILFFTSLSLLPRPSYPFSFPSPSFLSPHFFHISFPFPFSVTKRPPQIS